MRTTADNRRSKRFGWKKQGVLRSPEGPDRPCSIEDISQHGARLSAVNTEDLPDRCALVVREGAIPRPCRIVWRAPSALGLEFDSAPAQKRSGVSPGRPRLALDC